MISRIFLILVFLSSLSAFGTTKIAVINDLNGEAGSLTYGWKVASAVGQIIAARPDLVILPGDLVAGESSALTQAHLQAMWDSFDKTVLSQFQKMNIPLAPAPGNHDAGLIRDRVEYKRFWIKNEGIPQVDLVDATHFPFYYSYIVKNIFFIAMDDVTVGRVLPHPHSLGSAAASLKLKADLEAMSNPQIQILPESKDLEQKLWIKTQLASPEAKSADARIVYGHVPLYSVLDPARYQKPQGGGKFHEVLSREQMLKNTAGTLEEILIDGNVSLTIFAHSHAFYPATIKHQDRPEKNPLHVLFTPCIGAANRHLPGATERSPNGYVIISVEDTHLSYQLYNAQGELISKETLPATLPLKDNVTLIRD
ncbi:MAG: hypothetical protein A2X86_01885 [Bdellovibrionales bacterium GWA2_49_15]|nr:MAG: hypothetical protein A2X86_01885 [Bdellovibrionales bacterium GWA2_49_15]